MDLKALERKMYAFEGKVKQEDELENIYRVHTLVLHKSNVLLLECNDQGYMIVKCVAPEYSKLSPSKRNENN